MINYIYLLCNFSIDRMKQFKKDNTFYNAF